jgi:hypothetical protein
MHLFNFSVSLTRSQRQLHIHYLRIPNQALNADWHEQVIVELQRPHGGAQKLAVLSFVRRGKN